MMFLFFLPFLYTYKTRLNSGVSLLSWIAIYPMLLFIFCFLFAPNLSASEIMVFFISLAIIYNLYEIGYIYNDTETIKIEEKPTLRLSSIHLKYYYLNKRRIYASRLFLSLFFCYLLTHYFSVSLLNVAIAWLIIPVFFAYNKIRSRLNLILHFFLVMLRYFGPVFITMGNDGWLWRLFYIALLFPVANLFERCREKRFELSFFIRLSFSNMQWRQGYYFLVLLIAFIGYLRGFPFSDAFLSCAIWMCIYRTLSPIFVKR